MKEKNSFFIVIILTIIFLFLFLIPKLSIKIFPFVKDLKFKKFKNYLLTTNSFDPQVFWQFREFFCPGYFVFQKDDLVYKKNNKNNSSFFVKDFLKNLNEIDFWFAKYNCSYLESYEGLTQKINLDYFLDEEEIKKEADTLRKTDEFIFLKKKKSDNYFIIFLLDQEKMKRAVGFFDYNEKDKLLLEGKKWFNFTVIKI